MPVIHPVILSGGTGSRLWPLSRSLFPKQLLALASERSLIQDTLLRATGTEFAPALIICNTEHRFLIAEQMRQAGVTPREIILEPVGRNTAPAAAIAALILAQTDPDAAMLLMPADHIVKNRSAFLQAGDSASAAPRHDRAGGLGVTAHPPGTGCGDIAPGPP